MRRKIPHSMILAMGMCALLLTPAAAQDAGSEEEKEQAREQAEAYDWSPSWEYELTPYFWLSQIKGTAAIEGEEFPIDLSGFDDLNLVFSFHFEAQRKKLAGWLGITVTDMEQDYTTGGGDPGKFRLKILRPEAAAAYRLFASHKAVLEGYAGFRYTDWKPRFERTVQVPGEPSAIEAQKGWLDPMIGARFRTQIGPRVPVFIRGDVGGFGVGADLAWYAQAGLAYMFSPHLALAGAYRFYSTDYNSGSGDSGFSYDADQQGPLIGVSLLF